jgi:hypothetical protein
MSPNSVSVFPLLFSTHFRGQFLTLAIDHQWMISEWHGRRHKPVKRLLLERPEAQPLQSIQDTARISKRRGDAGRFSIRGARNRLRGDEEQRGSKTLLRRRSL